MKKYDYILICAFLIISVILFSIYYINKKPGMYVTVNTDGSIYTCLPLNKDTVIRIPQTGNDYNIICIKDGYVSVTDADCPDLICTKHARISQTGETIICLPHKLSVTITDTKSY
ncbi:MAG: NusG domain II-containing protein [Lachnospiraceae bacterium]|jgi:conserved hypothetical protein